MAFRLGKGWQFSASPRRRPRQPFRRTTFPGRRRAGRAAETAPVAAAAPPAEQWVRGLLDALAGAASDVSVRGRRDSRMAVEQKTANVRRRDRTTGNNDGARAIESARPVLERLDRQRELLARMEEHLRRLVDQAGSRDDAAVFSPPA